MPGELTEDIIMEYPSFPGLIFFISFHLILFNFI